MNYKNFLLILLFSIITANAQKREINAEIINFNHCCPIKVNKKEAKLMAS